MTDTKQSPLRLGFRAVVTALVMSTSLGGLALPAAAQSQKPADIETLIGERRFEEARNTACCPLPAWQAAHCDFLAGDATAPALRPEQWMCADDIDPRRKPPFQNGQRFDFDRTDLDHERSC